MLAKTAGASASLSPLAKWLYMIYQGKQTSTTTKTVATHVSAKIYKVTTIVAMHIFKERDH